MYWWNLLILLSDQSQFLVLICLIECSAGLRWDRNYTPILITQNKYTIKSIALACITMSVLPVSIPGQMSYEAHISGNHLFIYSTNIYCTLYVGKVLLPAFVSPYFLRSCFLRPVGLKRVIRNCEEKGTIFALPQNTTHLEDG